MNSSLSQDGGEFHDVSQMETWLDEKCEDEEWGTYAVMIP